LIWPPAEVYASLLDQGVYLCSIRTCIAFSPSMTKSGERRRHCGAPSIRSLNFSPKAKSGLVLGHNQVDGAPRMELTSTLCHHRYFSRRIVAWCIADAESATLFKPLFDDAIVKHNVAPGQLTLHADRGGPMKAKALPCCSPISASQNRIGRPYTSNDNPFSKATSRP